MACSTSSAVIPLSLVSHIFLPSSPSTNLIFPIMLCRSSVFTHRSQSTSASSRLLLTALLPRRRRQRLCRAAEYVFPDPVPEFADSETDRFRAHLLERLSKKDLFGDSVNEVVSICTEILSHFLHTEYGGPGTLLVVPFIDMADTINERGLPGGPQAARAAVVWAEKHVDEDWKEWTGGIKKSQ